MPAVKIGTLILYFILFYVGYTKPLTLGANLSIGLLVLLGLAHTAECVVYRRLIQQAPGSPAWNTLNVLLFGVFHMMVMKDAVDGDVQAAT